MWNKLLPKTNTLKLPKSVLRQIHFEQDRAEIAISWIQLGIFGLLFVLWAISPKASQNQTDFELIPVVLGLYLPFVIAKTYWAHRRLVNGPLLYLSIVLDFGMLTALIWLFHYQYMQTPGFSLKAPTFVYYFIFIALRALRFETKYILFAGAMAVLSWSALVSLCVFHHDSVITNNFLEYTLSHKILIGVELEKLLAIVVVSALLVFAAARSQRIMRKAVEGSRFTSNLSRFFSPEISKIIMENEKDLASGHGTQRFAAILVVDIIGFTRLNTSLSPNQVMELISEYQSVVVPMIFANQGCVDKYLGDGILAHFGAASSSASFAADCLRAVDEIVIAVEKWNRQRERQSKPPISIKMACAVGSVNFGTTGEKNRLEFTTIGEAVNLAAKLEKHAPVLEAQALTTVKTLSIAKDQGYRQKLDPPRFRSCKVEGLHYTIDLMVLYKQKIKRKLKRAA